MTDKEKNDEKQTPEKDAGEEVTENNPTNPTEGETPEEQSIGDAQGEGESSEPVEYGDYYQSVYPGGQDADKPHDPDDYPNEDSSEPEDGDGEKEEKSKKKSTPPPPPVIDKDDDDDDGDDDDDDGDDDDDESGAKMPFLDHLEELRWTILRGLIGFVVGAIGCFFFSEKLIGLLLRPVPDNIKLVTLAPADGFMTYIKVSLYAGAIVALPYIAFQFWLFIVPGLLERERKYVPHITFFTTFCFLTGAMFAYFIIIPYALNFLLNYGGDHWTNQPTVGKYLGFMVTIIVSFGAVFELPVLSFFLTQVGIITPDFLKRNRRYGIVVIFIMAAVLTPPDVFTQLMLAGPLILLYEISILVSRSVYRKKKAQEEAEEED